MSLKTLLKTDLLVLGCLIGVAFFSCSDTRPDRSGLEQENKNREVKVLKQTDIIALAQSTGEEIFTSLENNHSKWLLSNTNLNSCTKASWIDLLDSAQINLVNSIKRIGFSDSLRLDDRNLSQLEKRVLEAYQYNWEENLMVEANLQKDKQNQSYLYSSAIYLNNNCTKCHESQEKVVGIWLIDLNEKQVIIRQK